MEILLLIFVMGGWLLLVPAIFSFIYGYKIKTTGAKRIFSYLAIVIFISFIVLFLAGYLLRGLAYVDSRPPYPFDVTTTLKGAGILSFVLLILNLPVFVLGIFAKHLKNKTRK